MRNGPRLVAVLTLALAATSLIAQTTWRVAHLAGYPGPFGYEDGTASESCFKPGYGRIAADANGGLYLADAGNYTIRKLALDGSSSTLAGMPTIQGTDDGSATDASFEFLGGIAVAPEGSVFVTDRHAIRKITGNSVTTVAGSHWDAGFADGTGAAARFNGPSGLAAGPDGNLYVADTYNHAIRKVTPAGVVSTYAGLPGTNGTADGDASTARFDRPSGLVFDAAGNLYVADSGNYAIRKITPAGTVTTLAGLPGHSADEPFATYDGTGTGARFYTLNALALAKDGSLYAVEEDVYHSVIRKITMAGVVTTFAGAKGTTGLQDGIGSSARFYWPRGIAAASDGNLYVTEHGSNAVRKVTLGAEVTSIAGGPGCFASRGLVDGDRLSARFGGVWDVAADSSGNVYVADSYNHVIRKITTAGLVSTLAGLGGAAGSSDGAGASARFNSPTGIIFGADGNLYVADSNGVRKVTPFGGVTTTAHVEATNVARDSAGNLYIVASSCNPVCVSKIAPNGSVTPIAGTSNGGLVPLDGTGTAATFFMPRGIAVASNGMIYVADGYRVIRQVTQQGVVTTIAGDANGGWVDGNGSGARFWGPTDIAIGPDGNLYVTDTFTDLFGNHSDTIRRVTPSGTVTTVIGVPESGRPGSCDFNDGFGWEGGDALDQRAQLCRPQGLTFDNSGRIIIADGGSVRLASKTDVFDYAPRSATGYVGWPLILHCAPGTATTWSWSMVRREAGSLTALVAPNTPDVRLTPDRVGRDLVRLIATQPEGFTISQTDVRVTTCTAPTATVSSNTSWCTSLGPVPNMGIAVQLTGVPPWTITWSDGYVQTNVTNAFFYRMVSPATTTDYWIESLSDATPCPGISSGTSTQTIVSAEIQAAPAICVKTSDIAWVSDAGVGATYAWTITGGSIISGVTSRLVTYASAAPGSVRLDVAVSAPFCNGLTGSTTIQVSQCACGDDNGNGQVEIGDVFYLVNNLFGNGPPPVSCGDANSDGAVSSADAVYLVNYLMARGPIPQ